MTFNDSPNISFEFQDDDGKSYLKIRPRSMQFDRTRGQFDYCQAEFAEEVATHIQPHLDDPTSFIRQPLPVTLHIEGEPVYRLLWVPDGVTFGEDTVHIEFHDPQKSLTRGVIDWRHDNVKLEDAYRHVFNSRNQTGPTFFNDIKFTVPEEAYDELRTKYRDGPIGLNLVDEKTRKLIAEERDEEVGEGGVLFEDAVVRRLEEENVYNIINGHNAVDFNKISPWEAITRLNEKFGVTTWAAPDGNLYVGSRRATGYQHLAVPDDRRVWKLSDYNVTASRDPVVRSVVRGGWTDDPSETWAEQASEIADLNRGTKDFRIEAVAETQTSSFLGQEVFVELKDAKKDTLENIAKRKMMNKQREQQSGYIEIDPELSGDQLTNVRYASIGDTVLTLPPEDDHAEGSICDTNIETEMLDVVGVQHELTEDGEWNLRLDVVKQLDGELSPARIDTRLRYYNPSEKDTIEEDQYSTMVEEDEDGWWPDFF